MPLKPIDQIRYDTGRLIEDFPPRWQHENKKSVFEIACSSGFPFQGEIDYARWGAIPLPERVEMYSHFSVVPGYFNYFPPAAEIVEWHLNFADRHLFVAYRSALMAQDELQVAEHPILGSLREALISQGRTPETLDDQGAPTPITITGVQRRCSIDTSPDSQAGRPDGLYGNAFARASRDQVIAATRPISPPTISNILAMAAPAYGSGRYRLDQIQQITQNAYTGYMAARAESARIEPAARRALIHTGFWGCGAFGGNRTLMTILQALASDLAGVDIVFHAFDEAGVASARQALEKYQRMRASNASVAQILDKVNQQAFQWGVSDGN